MGSRTAAGAVTPVPEYYPMIRDICTRHNVLWIADEIMAKLKLAMQEMEAVQRELGASG